MVEEAYRHGIFPMADMDLGVVSWYRPRLRAVIPLDCFHVSRSLERRIRRGGFTVTFDRGFSAVMRACADRPETWISPEFVEVYTELHRRGQAHSVEVWVDGELAAGVYGVHLGGAFFAESMFHSVTDMSKVALKALADRLLEQGFALFEVQYLTPHLARFGAVQIPNREYLRRLDEALALDCRFHPGEDAAAS